MNIASNPINLTAGNALMDSHMLAPQAPSCLANWALLVAQAIESYGLNSQQVFKEAGGDLNALKKNDKRFPGHIMLKVWQIAVARSQDHYIAIRVAHFFKPSVYSALGMSIMASRHVYDALKRANRYGCFIGNAYVSSLQESHGEVEFVLRATGTSKAVSNIYGMSATLCCMYNILSELSVEKLKIKEVHFEQSLPSNQELEAFFGCPVFYGASCNKMVLDKQSLFTLQPFPQNQLAGSLDDWLEEYLSKNHHDRISARVQEILFKNLLHGKVDLPRVASALAMGIRVLQRKLQEEGTLYSELLDDCRKKLSVQLILNNQHQISEVSSLLGFSNQSNFTRAFRRWTGTTPLKYRG